VTGEALRKEDEIMEHRGRLAQSRPRETMTAIAVTLVMTFVLGCATAETERVGTYGPEQASQRDAADLAFYHSQQAAEFRNLAQRFEVEANLLVSRFGEHDEAAMRKRAFAKEMRVEAEKAAQTAEEYRRQVPHAQVY
jgi:hypothetical protein